MLAKYRHPNIVLMIGAISKPPQLCLVMELVKEGTLFDLIHRRKTNFTDMDKKKLAFQMINVINYLHKHGIVHRDIKSHNMLIDKNYHLKICDFGLAKHKVHLQIYRVNSIVDPCNSVVLRLTWLLNYSKKEHIMSQ